VWVAKDVTQQRHLQNVEKQDAGTSGMNPSVALFMVTVIDIMYIPTWKKMIL
jgi:hypothetical protein